MGRVKKRVMQLAKARDRQHEVRAARSSAKTTASNPLPTDPTPIPSSSSSSTPPRSTSPTPNQFQTPVPLLSSTPRLNSASTKVLRLENDPQRIEDLSLRSKDDSVGNLLVKFDSLSLLIKSFPCKLCLTENLTTRVLCRKGLACEIEVWCDSCQQTVMTWWTSERSNNSSESTRKHTHFTIN